MAKAKAKAKKPARNGGGAKKPTEVLVVGSKVKAAIKAADCNTGGDVIDAINGYVYWVIGQATARAKSNGRKTVRGHDVVLM